MDKHSDETLKDILSHAKELEHEQNIEEAIALYKKAIKKDTLSEDAYNRLMILFRKQKDYKQELHIIKEAIKVFKEFYDAQIPNKSRTITELSNKLNRSTGLADKKGNTLYNPEPIAAWKKRKTIVEKKLNG
jgi:tetratricopeptide (TPR) repeat protein